MSIALYRIDDRLIHGQVVVGWGKPLNVGFIVLVDDAVRASTWEQELYRMGVPAGIEVVFASTAEALACLPDWERDARVGLLVAGDIDTLATLAGDGHRVTRINLGGLHHRPGRSPRLRYVYLSDAEAAQLKALAARYPEYGPATVAAVSAAHAAAGTLGLGLGALVGLITGMAGGVSLHAVRRLNARAVRRATAALEAGDARVLVRLHTAAILRDAARAAVVTALGLGLALLARTYLAGTISARGVMLLDVAAVGSALAVGTAGTLRLVGRGPDLRWFAAGVVGGAAVAWLR